LRRIRDGKGLEFQFGVSDEWAGRPCGELGRRLFRVTSRRNDASRLDEYSNSYREAAWSTWMGELGSIISSWAREANINSGVEISAIDA